MLRVLSEHEFIFKFIHLDFAWFLSRQDQVTVLAEGAWSHDVLEFEQLRLGLQIGLDVLVLLVKLLEAENIDSQGNGSGQ